MISNSRKIFYPSTTNENNRMIERNEYCIDILNQTKAAKNALENVENKILEKHLNECIKESINNPKNADKKIAELIKTLKRR